MSDPGAERFDPTWLQLREPADAAARSLDLAAAVAGHVAAPRAAHPAGRPGPVVVHDLGCGSGSMARWLAPRLPGPQHWVLHDRDPDLLALAVAGLPPAAADGTAVTGEARRGELARLAPGDLAGADLVTASALLDLLTRSELADVAKAVAAPGAPVLFALSVAGHVELDPPDPLDAAVAAAFDAHQRRTVDGRRLLGPDAVAAAVEVFTDLGLQVQTRPSPWRLAAADAALKAAWLDGWVGAAAEHDPGLPAGPYLARRREEAGAGRLRVVVHHTDLLARHEAPGETG